MFGIGIVFECLFIEDLVFVIFMDGGDVEFTIGGCDLFRTVEMQCFVRVYNDLIITILERRKGGCK